MPPFDRVPEEDRFPEHVYGLPARITRRTHKYSERAPLAWNLLGLIETDYDPAPYLLSLGVARVDRDPTPFSYSREAVM